MSNIKDSRHNLNANDFHAQFAWRQLYSQYCALLAKVTQTVISTEGVYKLGFSDDIIFRKTAPDFSTNYSFRHQCP